MRNDLEIYADGFAQIHWLGGMARMDVVSVDSPGSKGHLPTTREGIRIIMPPEGFLNAYESMRQLIDRLISAGVLEKAPATSVKKPAEKKKKRIKKTS